MSVDVHELSFSRRDRKRFIQVAFDLRRSEPLWVPPLRLDHMRMMDPGSNPFFEHATVRHLVAVKDGRDAGRVAVVVNARHNEVHEERTAHFGFFEAEDGGGAAALLAAAEDRARTAGMDRLLGPASYSTNDVVGLLVEGHDLLPSILMPYDPPSYAGWIEGAGYRKAKDLLALEVAGEHELSDRLRRLIDRLARRTPIRLRPLDMKRFDDEVALVRDLYNRSWERNWGFVPMTDAELTYMAKDLKPIVDPACVLFAEIDGQVAGFSLAIPDLNRILVKIRSGRLFPTGLLRILLGKGKLRNLRLLTLGVLPEHRSRGIDAVLVHGAYEKGQEAGYDACECSWVLEDNDSMLSGIEQLGGRITKRYRVYEKAL